jgi:hypothetical protein
MSTPQEVRIRLIAPILPLALGASGHRSRTGTGGYLENVD